MSNPFLRKSNRIQPSPPNNRFNLVILKAMMTESP